MRFPTFHRLLCLLLLGPALVRAEALEVSIPVPYGLAAQALEAAPPATFENGPCSTLTVAQRRLEVRADGLYLVNAVALSTGAKLREGCGERAVWHGVAALRLEPRGDAAWRLRFGIGRTELRDDRGGEAPVLGLLWELARGRLEGEAEALTLDLAPAREALTAVLRAAAPASSAAPELRAVAAEAGGLVLRVGLSLPDAGAAPGDASAMQRLEALDAFLVFVVKEAGRDLADEGLRRRLLELLLRSREADEGAAPRTVLAGAWPALRDILQEAAQRQLVPEARLRRWSLLLGCGEALLALEAARPGPWIARPSLEQLERVLQPGAAPLDVREGVDPQLRSLFGFPPEPLHGASVPPEGLLQWLVRPAQAEAGKVLGEVGKRLRNWVPRRWELPEYRAWVSALLGGVVAEELERAGLKESEQAALRALVPATALMESCWRQFERKEGKVGPVISPGGSVGIMQVNARAWRGFYDRGRLERDVVYNARAGTQILLRYLKDPGREIAARTGQPEHLPRAAYAAYNGGPQAGDRFLTPKGVLKPGPRDRKFWTFYQGFAAGRAPSLNKCAMPAP